MRACLSIASIALLGCEGMLFGTSGPVRTDAGTLPPMPDASIGVDAFVAPGVDAGPIDPCAGVSCGAHQHCDPVNRSCVCDTGFVSGGADCVVPPIGDPATRTEAEVCARWSADHAETASPPWIAGTGECDVGTMPREAIDDTLVRIALFRWLAGLPPVGYNPADHDALMQAAAIMNANRSLNHSPPSDWRCWTAEGASAAGRANLALGSPSSAASIDLYMQDPCWESVCSLGHRRWLLNPGLGVVAMGSVAGAHALGVFDGSGSTDRAWAAYPNPGPAPMDLANATWSFHANSFGVGGATVRVVRVSDGAELEVVVHDLGSGYGSAHTLSWDRVGWGPTPGERYRVTIGGTSVGDITYEVLVAGC
jgi:hypothetical protein